MSVSGAENRNGRLKDAILIAGPTASGKSALALALAREMDGVIINTDSMQVYSVLRVLTARPGPEDLRQAPHQLYGHVHPGEAYSTGRWLGEVSALIDEGVLAGRRAIFVGGTGLYFRALTEGLSPMPSVPVPIRDHWRARLAEEGPATLHALLRERDPATASALQPADGQRIVRALEVLEASGRPLSAWQGEASGGSLVDPASCRCLVLEPARPLVTRRIEARFEAMVEQGGLDEVRALLALDLPPDLPAMKAIGVRELAAFLAGTQSRDEAITQAKAATRRYAKRQMTWFRNQFGAAWRRVAFDDGEAPLNSVRDMLGLAP
ncbi:tRNA (adenosine(37)-N6)-dimethylallyltransferase MiaA [Nitratireductor pacificus]|uniref:tRNA dimethylallyltransferase n=1 Tax=Nitratireductor pacificus pht-3B TaxID=391937 RepID=K2MJF7_9HYPH|nr:tRNA (adenosine(37)-N6)-dimethylallyltransferase MiaA [Nitratireductor pacificus]EKF20845.1 tRNA delta(2)-isopentenylpyrophosphate transferase [Nitratireductor pacificus pht-3B]